jgi:hypothetical protein
MSSRIFAARTGSGGVVGSEACSAGASPLQESGKHHPCFAAAARAPFASELEARFTVETEGDASKWHVKRWGYCRRQHRGPFRSRERFVRRTNSSRVSLRRARYGSVRLVLSICCPSRRGGLVVAVPRDVVRAFIAAPPSANPLRSMRQQQACRGGGGEKQRRLRIRIRGAGTTPHRFARLRGTLPEPPSGGLIVVS